MEVNSKLRLRELQYEKLVQIKLVNVSEEHRIHWVQVNICCIWRMCFWFCYSRTVKWLLILSLRTIRKRKAKKAFVKKKAQRWEKLLIWWIISSIDKGQVTPCFTISFISLSSHLECKDFNRNIIPDLKELDERGFLFGTRKIKKLLGVPSLWRRNCPFTRVVTRLVSISTIHPLLAKDSMRYCFDWLTYVLL